MASSALPAAPAPAADFAAPVAPAASQRPAAPAHAGLGARRRGSMSPACAVGIEIAKMRRLRTLPVTLAFVAATIAMGSMSLFSESGRADLSDPAAMPWASLLLNLGLVSALTGPILMSVLASRQTDIEHSGSGWNLASTLGLTPGALCRVKLAALSAVIIPAILLQVAGLMAVARLMGLSVPMDVAPWAAYTLLLIAVNIAVCSFHIWLAAVVDNQIVVVGVGLLGSFISLYMLLAPGWLARLVPWGYYAVITPAKVTYDGQTAAFTYIEMPWGWAVGFLALAGLAFAALTRRLDRIER